MNFRKSSIVVVAVVLGFALAPPALAVQQGDVTFQAEVNGRGVEQVDANEPLRLSADRGADVRVRVRNDGSDDLRVDSVRLESRVLGLAFVTYTTRVDMVVGPGEQQERRFVIDTSDLAGQATGLLPASVSLWRSGDLVAQDDLAVDVRGSITSLYGVFGLAVAATTVLLLVAALYRLATHQLSGNRWLRATRFAVPAAGLGLTLTFTLSALRLLMPAPSASLGFVLGGAGLGLVLGYFTPDPRVTDRSVDDVTLLAELLARRDAELQKAERSAVAPPQDRRLPAIGEQRVAGPDEQPVAELAGTESGTDDAQPPGHAGRRAPTTVVIPQPTGAERTAPASLSFPAGQHPPAPRPDDDQRTPLDR